MNSSSKKSGFFNVLAKTRNSITSKISSFFSKTSTINQAEVEQLHDTLILSDIGFEVSQNIIDSVQAAMKRSKISGQQVIELVPRELVQILLSAESELNLERNSPPTVIMMVGVNGVGKTTTTAKIAKYLQQQQHSVMLAACDTYRPAAIEQLQTWGSRLKIPVIAQSAGTDPAAVAHDAMHAASARKNSVLIVDTGGRQQTRDDLMRQLGKIRRVIGKIETSAPHHTLITIDAGTGQNALSQVEIFHQHTPISGICVTKLDGTAKGGIVVALSQRFDLPIHFVGLGEGINDLSAFRAQDYVTSLLGSSG